MASQPTGLINHLEEWIGHQQKRLHKEYQVLRCPVTPTIRHAWFQQAQQFCHPSYINVPNVLFPELVSVHYIGQFIKKRSTLVLVKAVAFPILVASGVLIDRHVLMDRHACLRESCEPVSTYARLLALGMRHGDIEMVDAHISQGTAFHWTQSKIYFGRILDVLCEFQPFVIREDFS